MLRAGGGGGQYECDVAGRHATARAPVAPPRRLRERGYSRERDVSNYEPYRGKRRRRSAHVDAELGLKDGRDESVQCRSHANVKRPTYPRRVPDDRPAVVLTLAVSLVAVLGPAERPEAFPAARAAVLGVMRRWEGRRGAAAGLAEDRARVAAAALGQRDAARVQRGRRHVEADHLRVERRVLWSGRGAAPAHARARAPGLTIDCGLGVLSSSFQTELGCRQSSWHGPFMTSVSASDPKNAWALSSVGWPACATSASSTAATSRCRILRNWRATDEPAMSAVTCGSSAASLLAVLGPACMAADEGPAAAAAAAGSVAAASPTDLELLLLAEPPLATRNRISASSSGTCSAGGAAPGGLAGSLTTAGRVLVRGASN